MSQPHPASQSMLTAPTEIPLSLPTVQMKVKLAGKALKITRVLWVILAFYAISMFVLSVPAHYHSTRTIVADDANEGFYRLRPSEAAVLRDWGLSPEFYAAVLNGANILFMLAFAGIAIFLFVGRSDDLMVITVSLAIMLHGATYGASTDALVHEYPALLTAANLLRACAYVFTMQMLYIFPNGQFQPRWTRITSLIWITWTLLTPFVPILNPFQPSWVLGISLYMAWYSTGVYAQIYRYRKIATPLQREQTRWIVAGISVAVLCFALYVSLPLFISALAAPGSTRLLYNLIAIPLLYFAPMVLVPVMLAVAVMRHRLWDVNMVLHRAMVYGTLTGALAVLYVGFVVILQQVFLTITGGTQSSVAIAVSAVGIALIFQPLRQHLQTLVDRRWARSKPVPHLESKFAGATFGAYEVQDLIGRGGTAEVYKGYHPALKRDVAIKIMFPDIVSDFRVRFEREAQMVAGLHHPNVVQVYDFGERENTYFMIMEYIPGKDLAHYMRAIGPLPMDMLHAFACDIGAALDYAHGQGIVHRDVKPSNVLLRQCANANGTNGTNNIPCAVLTDFGIARLMEQQSRLTKTETMGTLDYMAPEQICSAKEADQRADVYALGIMLYQMATGELPFKGANLGEVILAQLQKPAPDPRLLRPDLSEGVARAILRALAKSPDERFQRVSELVEALA